MKKTSLISLAALMLAAPSLAQAAAAAAPAQPQIREDSLDPSPVDPARDPNVDLFIGDYRNSPPRTLYGGLVFRDILTRLEGNRLQPARKGAVLEIIQAVSYATLQPGATASGRVQAGQHQLFYMTEGVGEIVVNGKTHELREGTGFVLTPNHEFRIVNKGSDHLAFFVRTETPPANYQPTPDLLIGNRFANDRQVGNHWWHTGTGTAGGVGLQTLAPYTMPHPHSHQNEEVWIMIKGETVLSIGKNLRTMVAGQAIRIPPTALTAHSNINMGSEPVQMMVIIPRPGNTDVPVDHGRLRNGPFDPAVEPDIDMFMGAWRYAPSRIMHGNLYFRDMLTGFQGNDPVRPSKTGAVLRNATAVSHAMLEPGSTAHRIDGQLTDAQQVFIVQSGTGTITSGSATVSLSEGMAFIVPAGVDFRLTASGDRYMNFYVVTEKLPPGTAPARAVKVIDNRGAPEVLNAWASRERPIVTRADGLVQYQAITASEVSPNAMTRPYSVAGGGEEVWIMTEGNVDLLLGKQLRKLSAGGAFAVPPTGISAQTKLNLSGQTARFIYLSK